MRNGTAERVTLNTAAEATLRILIASYFIAVALRIIPGTDLALLFNWAMPGIAATALSAGLVFLLAFMIMIAVYTRVAALILGMMTFYASYLAMVELGVETELGSFWRDLALIAALLLTYSDHGPAAHRRRAPIQRRVAPRRVASILARVEAEGMVATRRPAPEAAVALPTFKAAPRPGRTKGTHAILDRVEAHLAGATPSHAPLPSLEQRLSQRIARGPVEPEIENIFSITDGDYPA
ncbi:hypothetical protein N0B44_27900 [Roseibacterium beibuensis]|uniref:DoxX family protein n=1 Tax=[Roseibacterium] beibuensis TaxID=1193142 RepID=A0ABP9LNK7_9RHOB|nr:hypothetical protein [Roseibacterium beibuensis]MCS6626748.1 hypothetical protein [Roseibacterium beibuensis]